MRSIYELMEDAYGLAAIEAGIKQEIWLPKHDPDNPRVLAIRAYWRRLGLLESLPVVNIVAPVVTDLGREIIDLRDLIGYELSMLSLHRDDDLKTTGMAPPALYHQLRKGLGAYFDQYLTSLFATMGLVDMKAQVLELGAGEGALASLFLAVNADSKYVATDRFSTTTEHNVQIHELNFQTINWVEHLKQHNSEPFGLVILSEVLHCKDYPTNRQLLDDIFRLLPVGGQLLIMERYPTKHLAWRLALMSNGGPLQPGDVEGLAGLSGYTKIAWNSVGGSHYATLFQKPKPRITL